ncbi:intron-encoded reverse transcriptase aI1 (mitochondrion) [Saccharomyces cerevisiae]|nr:intron-encoded reverse transcriptase aI1 [Saccharomyces cerevisiae]
MKDTNNTKGNTKSEGSTERGNSGVDRGMVVPNTQMKMRFLNQVRYYSVNNNLKMGKDTNIELSKDTSTSDLLELEKLVMDNMNEENMNNNLLSIMKNVDMLMLAYNRIKSKPGNMTPGTTLETLDGMNMMYLNKLSNELGTGKFKFKPMRMVNIPKPKGGMRPLSVGNPRDKIVQEVMRMILDTIFDKKMSTHSHGFRKNMNKGFIDLVYKLLRAGYIDEKGTYHKPMLGKVKKQHPTYKKLSRMIAKAKMFSTRLKLHKERAKGPTFIYNDPNFKRMKYVRYADDILIGVLGSKNDCKMIKRDLNNFLNSLGLTMNEEKTLITCATETPARFLGYNISITPLKRMPTVTKTIRGKTIRSRNTTRPIINAPIRDIINKLATNGYCKHNKNGRMGVPTRVALGRGILNYYKLATNYKRLRERIYYVLYYSCVLTLASKYRLKTMSKTIKKFGYNLNIIENDKLIANFPRNTFDNIKKIENHGMFMYMSEAKVTDPFEYIDSIKYMLPTAKANFNKPCSICNSTIDVEMHHVKQLHRGMLKATKDYITGRMITMNRKQIPLCKQCHIKTHKNKFKNMGPGM